MHTRSEREPPRTVRDGGSISIIRYFLKPDGYCGRILSLRAASTADLTATTDWSVTSRRRQPLSVQALCRVASTALPWKLRRRARRLPACGRLSSLGRSGGRGFVRRVVSWRRSEPDSNAGLTA